MPARAAGLQGSEGNDIDHVIFLLRPAFAVTVRFVVISLHTSGLTVADILTSAPDDFLTDRIRGPFVRFIITVLAKYFRTEIAKQ